MEGSAMIGYFDAEKQSCTWSFVPFGGRPDIIGQALLDDTGIPNNDDAKGYSSGQTAADAVWAMLPCDADWVYVYDTSNNFWTIWDGAGLLSLDNALAQYEFA